MRMRQLQIIRNNRCTQALGVHQGSYFNTLILLHFFVCIYRGFISETGGDTASKKEKGKKEVKNIPKTVASGEINEDTERD